MRPFILSLVAGSVAALPSGFSTYFVENCPTGWSEIVEAKGRVVVSVVDALQGGLTVGTALGDREDRTHTHSFDGSLTLPSKGEVEAWMGAVQGPVNLCIAASVAHPTIQ
jgi:hypothetical protein